MGHAQNVRAADRAPSHALVWVQPESACEIYKDGGAITATVILERRTLLAQDVTVLYKRFPVSKFVIKDAVALLPSLNVEISRFGIEQVGLQYL